MRFRIQYFFKFVSIRCAAVIFFWFVSTYSGNCLAQDIHSFPLKEIHSIPSVRGLIFYITGDGGWNLFSRELCDSLAKRGYAVVALNAREYFWDERTPESSTVDITFIVKHFLAQWNIKSWYLIGYSFGADVAPFILNRLDRHALAPPEACVLLDPSETTDFEIHVTDMVSFSNTIRRFKVTDEILHVQHQTLCLFPLEDKRTLPANQNHFLHSLELPGDHRFDHNISAITRAIYSFLQMH